VIEDVNYYHQTKGRFVISTSPALLDEDAVLRFLLEAKWWPGVSRESLACALRHSLCFSLLENERQIGVARVITDYTTYAYLCDVFIIEERRRQGLGTWLIRCVIEHPRLRALKRIALITHDAQPFYLGLDFRFPAQPKSYMERLR
jgi:GNAT superfamily N-acetyltransferase